jgi:hypothetical protein
MVRQKDGMWQEYL